MLNDLFKRTSYCLNHRGVNIFHVQREAIAALICASDFPAATAFSMRASEMALLDPRLRRSLVNGTPNF